MKHLIVVMKLYCIGWLAMSEATKTSQAKSEQLRNLIIFAVLIMVIFGLFVWMISSEKKQSNKIIEKTNFSNPLEHAESETIVLERVQKSVEEAKTQTENLKKQFDAKMGLNASVDDSKQKELENRLKTLESKLAGNQNENEGISDNFSSQLAGSQH